MLAGIAGNAAKYKKNENNGECKFAVNREWIPCGPNDENDGRLYNKFGTISQRKDPTIGGGTTTGGSTPQKYAASVINYS
jgi:hypothetical protein